MRIKERKAKQKETRERFAMKHASLNHKTLWWKPVILRRPSHTTTSIWAKFQFACKHQTLRWVSVFMLPYSVVEILESEIREFEIAHERALHTTDFPRHLIPTRSFSRNYRRLYICIYAQFSHQLLLVNFSTTHNWIVEDTVDHLANAPRDLSLVEEITVGMFGW